MRLENKVVLVTGAALGYKNGGPSIGSSIAFKFAKEDASIAVVDCLKEMGQKTADRITELGGKAIFIQTDVSDTKQVKNAIKRVKKEFGALHCLVNCAASYEGQMANNVVEIPEEDWKRIIDINLNGYYRFAKYAIPVILDSGGGSIVNISSGAAYTVTPNFSVYPVTKAAINALSRSLALDFAPDIRTNAVCPGFVRIANSEGERTPEEVEEWIDGIARKYPLKKVCTVDEIADVVVFLASEKASYINGQCIRVDGGYSIADSHEY